MRVVAMAAALIILPLLPLANGKDDRSLTEIESQIGVTEENSSFPDSNTIGAIQEKLLLAETTISALTATVAEMGNSAEQSRRELSEAKLRLEILTNSTNHVDSDYMESKLLPCLRELRVLKQDNEYARQQILMLSEAVQMFLMTTSNGNPQSRVAVETELRKAYAFLGKKSDAPDKSGNPLTGFQVLDVKKDLSLVVINHGKINGARVGMPLKVVRNGSVINTIKIVDVREKFSGAVIQSLSSNSIQVEKGDSLEVSAQK